jgi:hypothetical protein
MKINHGIGRLAIAACFATCLGDAQALHLELSNGWVAGTVDAEIVSGLTVEQASMDLAPTVATGRVAIDGAFPFATDTFLDGSLGYGFERSASIAATAEATRIAISAQSATRFALDGVSTVSSLFESQRADLVTDVFVASATDPDGTPVSMMFSGRASASFDNGLPGAEYVAHFRIDILDGNDAVVASYAGVDNGLPEDFAISFVSRIGERLTIDVQFDTDLGLFAEVPGTGAISARSGLDASLQVTPVPEPGTWALMLTGMLALTACGVGRARR